MTKATVLQIRLTPEEKKLCQVAADQAQLSLSAWVRQRLLGVKRPVKPQADARVGMPTARGKRAAKATLQQWKCRNCKVFGEGRKGRLVAAHFVASPKCKAPSLQLVD